MSRGVVIGRGGEPSRGSWALRLFRCNEYRGPLAGRAARRRFRYSAESIRVRGDCGGSFNKSTEGDKIVHSRHPSDRAKSPGQASRDHGGHSTGGPGRLLGDIDRGVVAPLEYEVAKLIERFYRAELSPSVTRLQGTREDRWEPVLWGGVGYGACWGQRLGSGAFSLSQGEKRISTLSAPKLSKRAVTELSLVRSRRSALCCTEQLPWRDKSRVTQVMEVLIETNNHPCH